MVATLDDVVEALSALTEAVAAANQNFASTFIETINQFALHLTVVEYCVAQGTGIRLPDGVIQVLRDLGYEGLPDPF